MDRALGGGTNGVAAAAAVRSQNSAVDASVLHGMLEFFVALARCAAGGWADQEGVAVPVRIHSSFFTISSFVTLARCAGGGWADQEGIAVPVLASPSSAYLCASCMRVAFRFWGAVPSDWAAQC